jgi:hypothetical protein
MNNRRDNYNTPTPQKPDEKLHPPSIPVSHDPGLSNAPNTHIIMIKIGPQAPKPSPEQQQNQTV